MKRSLFLAATMCAVSLMATDIDVQKQKAAAAELKKTMMGELKAKLNESPVAAVEFCSKNAIDITNSVAKKHNLNIKRVSEKNRNPINSADENDKKALAQFAENMARSGKPGEYVVVNGKYYEPLVTNEMCVVCHGKDANMASETAQKIKQLYPNDKAVGYGVGELRGAISVW
ncbi:MAG: DUF3365 domain-containing protein [Campylobacteraceae bacterium]|nr:DUF3365 domain-containing protein [Campylobacteraceae bacterium]